MLGKVMATMKLHNQLMKPASDMAGGRGPCLKSSAVMNCGMEPRPIENPITTAIIQMQQAYDRKCTVSCNTSDTVMMTSAKIMTAIPYNNNGRRPLFSINGI